MTGCPVMPHNERGVRVAMTHCCSRCGYRSKSPSSRLAPCLVNTAVDSLTWQHSLASLMYYLQRHTHSHLHVCLQRSMTVAM